MKKKVLLISRRSTKPEALVRYWPGDTWDLHLYTLNKKEWFSGMSEQLGEKWISLIPAGNDHTTPGNAGRSKKRHPLFKNALTSKTKKVRKYIYHKIFRIHDKYFWKWAVPSLANISAILDKTKPDLVMSVYGPLTANMIARKIAVSRGIPWVAYFRDHCTTFNLMHRVPGLWHTQTMIDRWIHAPLNCLVGVSPEFVRILSRFYQIPATRSHVVAGTFDDRHLPEEIYAQCLNRRKGQLPITLGKHNQIPNVRVVYAGKLFEHRIEPRCTLQKALENLLDQGIPCEFKITVSNGYYCFPRKVNKMIEHLRSRGLTVIAESTEISYDRALRHLDAADVNVILEGIRPPHSTAGTLPLKVFDLMMIAKPAIAICAPSLPIGDFLKEAGIGISCSNVEHVVGAITEIWQWKQNGKLPEWYSPNADSIEQYSCRSMAKKMNQICEVIYNQHLQNVSSKEKNEKFSHEPH